MKKYGSTAPKGRQQAMTPKTVLIVEDNLISLRLTAKTISTEGYNILTANSAEQALDLLNNVLPDLVLMDLQLPGMSGFELTAIIKKNPETRDIIVVALTVVTEDGIEEKAFK